MIPQRKGPSEVLQIPKERRFCGGSKKLNETNGRRSVEVVLRLFAVVPENGTESMCGDLLADVYAKPLLPPTLRGQSRPAGRIVGY
jgi:hypothetical protein